MSKMSGGNSSSGIRWKQNSFLEAIIKRSNASTQYGSYVLANARLEGYPIVHASEKFVRQTGFCKADIVRKKMSFNIKHVL